MHVPSLWCTIIVMYNVAIISFLTLVGLSCYSSNCDCSLSNVSCLHQSLRHVHRLTTLEVQPLLQTKHMYVQFVHVQCYERLALISSNLVEPAYHRLKILLSHQILGRACRRILLEWSAYHERYCLLLWFTVPEDFDYNPHSGRHGDRSHRVELKRSSVEYIAPSEYMVSA